MKKKAAKRKRRQDLQDGNMKKRKKWLNCQETSDEALGITAKFMRPFDGPWLITNIIPPSYYEISDKEK